VDGREMRLCGRTPASARTRFLPRRRTVKTHPRGKRGRGRTFERYPRTSERKGRPDGNFPPKSSFMTSLDAPRCLLNLSRTHLSILHRGNTLPLRLRLELHPLPVFLCCSTGLGHRPFPPYATLFTMRALAALNKKPSHCRNRS
jgi:hypothetical protein